MRFTINGKYIAAMRVSDDQDDGDWYTTISDDVEQSPTIRRLRIPSDIAGYGHQIQVVTTWAELI